MMGMVMGGTGVILGFAAALAGTVLWMALLFPSRTARARAVLESRPGRCCLVGLILAAVPGAPAVMLIHARHGLLKLAGWGLLLPLLLVLLIGLAGMTELLSERVRSRSPAMTPLGALVAGIVTIELTLLLPFVGWFLLTPTVALIALGAGALGGWYRRREGWPPESPSADAIEADGSGIDRRTRSVVPASPARQGE